MPDTSTHLLARLTAGPDAAAWAALVERHLDAMRRSAAAAAGSGFADDAVQEAFLQVRGHAGLFRPPPADDGERAAGAWLRTIAANCALKLARAARRRRRHEQREPVMADPPPPVAAGLDGDEDRSLLHAALADLPERERRPIILRYFSGVSDKERLGAELGCSADAAGMRLHRALLRLRKRLARLGVVAALALLMQRLEAAEGEAGASMATGGTDPAFLRTCQDLLAGPMASSLPPRSVIPHPGLPFMRLALAASILLVIAGTVGLAHRRQQPVAASVDSPIVLTTVIAPPAVPQPPPTAEQTALDAADVTGVVTAQNGFAARLYGRLAKAQPGNMAISPLSIATALTLVMGGTTGRTHDGIRATIGYTMDDADIHRGVAGLAVALRPMEHPAEEDPVEPFGQPAPTGPSAPRSRGPVKDYDLELANALWLQSGWTLREPYAGLASRSYAGQVLAVDFNGDPAGATGTINRWVEERTHQRIRNLVTGLTPQVRLVVTDAVWLKAQWRNFFEAEWTRPGPFTTANGVVKVPLMNGSDESLYRRIPGGTVALRSCEGGLSLVVVVPDRLQGLPALEGQVAKGALPGWIAGCTWHLCEWVLPKMTMEQRDPLDLTDQLAALGFIQGPSEDYAALASAPADDHEVIRGAHIAHKVFLALEEKGMEAAAATAIVMLGGMPEPQKPVAVRCDLPFIWAIWHEPTKSILFIGRVSDPTKGL